MIGYNKETLRHCIEEKREQLNIILGRENIGKNDILKLSVELDGLITQYYDLMEE